MLEIGAVELYLIVKFMLGAFLFLGGLIATPINNKAVGVGAFFAIEAAVLIMILAPIAGGPFVGLPEEGKIYIVVGSTLYNATDGNATLTALQELQLDFANGKITPQEGTEFLYKTGEKLSFAPGDYVTYRAEKLERINLSLSFNPLNTSNSTGGFK